MKGLDRVVGGVTELGQQAAPQLHEPRDDPVVHENVAACSPSGRRGARILIAVQTIPSPAGAAASPQPASPHWKGWQFCSETGMPG